MTNGFYDCSKIITSKLKIKRFLMDAMMLSYAVALEYKYKKKPDGTMNMARQTDQTSCIADYLDKIIEYRFKRPKADRTAVLHCIDRFEYNRGEIPATLTNAEVSIVGDWDFIYCHLTVENIHKLIKKYNLKLIQWP